MATDRQHDRGSGTRRRCRQPELDIDPSDFDDITVRMPADRVRALRELSKSLGNVHEHPTLPGMPATIPPPVCREGAK